MIFNYLYSISCLFDYYGIVFSFGVQKYGYDDDIFHCLTFIVELYYTKNRRTKLQNSIERRSPRRRQT